MQVILNTDGLSPSYPISFEVLVAGKLVAVIKSVDETGNPFQKEIDESWSICFCHKEETEWREGFRSLTAAIKFAEKYFYPQG